MACSNNIRPGFMNSTVDSERSFVESPFAFNYASTSNYIRAKALQCNKDYKVTKMK